MREPVASGTPYSTATRWPMFKLRKYAGQSTVEAPLWPHRANPLATAGRLAKTSTGACTVLQILFIASTQIFRAKVCMRSLHDISSSEPETTHYRDPPNGLPHGRTRPREERCAALGTQRRRSVPLMFLDAWFGWSAMTKSPATMNCTMRASAML